MYAASEAWSALDTRIAEAAAESISIETILDWGIALKVYALLMLVGFGHLLSGYSLGCVSEELIDWFNYYDDKERNEGTGDKGNNSDPDPIGTASKYDIPYHLVVSIYGWITLSAMAAGSHVFFFSFFKLDDGFECDLKADEYTFDNTYSAIPAIAAAWTDRETCKANVLEIFDIVDVNKDGFVERCEDAMF